MIYAAVAGASYAAAGYRAVAFRDRRDAATIAVTAAFADVGACFTVSVPSLGNRLDEAAGIPNLSVMIGQVLALWFSMCMLTALLAWTSSSPRRAIARWWGVTAAGSATMVGLFLACGKLPEGNAGFDPSDARTPAFAVYLALYCLMFGICQSTTARLSLRMARDGGWPWLRRGLRMTAAGAVLGLVYCAIRIVDIGVAFDAHLPVSSLESPSRMLTALGVLLKISGWTATSWGPAAGDLIEGVRARRARRILHPLWSDLTAAAPVVLNHTPMGRTRSERAIWLANRQVTEIWDARRRLHDRFPTEAVPSDVTKAAAWFAAGLASNTDAADGYGGQDDNGATGDSTDRAWLVQVARHYAQLKSASAQPNAKVLTS